MQTQLQTYLNRRGHRMNLQVQNSVHIFNRRVILVLTYTSNKTVNNLSMHDDSLDAQTGHHRLRVATLENFNPKPFNRCIFNCAVLTLD